jgi:hypothetical protein
MRRGPDRAPSLSRRLGVALGTILLAASSTARAATEFSTKVQVYEDSDRTTVVSPHFRISTTISGTALEAAYAEDVVTSASIDVRTTASPAIRDKREELSLGVARTINDISVGVGYTGSREIDYRSQGGSLSLSRDFNEKNTTVALRGNYTNNIVSRSGDPGWQAPMREIAGDLVFTQTIDAVTIAQIAATYAHGEGFMASPYRKVLVADGQYYVPETQPGLKDRYAVALMGNRFFGDGMIGQVNYRLYYDTFGVMSHTADLRYIFEWRQVVLRLRYRYYIQDAADFYKSRYSGTAVPTYVTSDREQSPLSSHLGGFKLEWNPARRLGRAAFRFDIKVEGMYFQYEDFPPLKTRLALNTQFGVAVEF